MVYCTNCGNESLDKKVCEHCGVKHNKNRQFCAWCGTEFVPRKHHCPNCGEPRRIASGIGTFFRVFFAICFLIAGIANIVSVPLPAIFFLIFGILLFPYSKKVFRKLTHNNMKLRKIISFIVSPALLIMAFVCTDACLMVNDYDDAVEDWNDQIYAKSMYYFSRYPDYKDNSAYIEKFESDVYAALTETPWHGGYVLCPSTFGIQTSTMFTFRADGTVLTEVMLWDDITSDKPTSSNEYESTYTLGYEINDDLGIYEVQVLVGSEREHGYHYSLTFTTDENGVIDVILIDGEIYVYAEEPYASSMLRDPWERVYFTRKTSE